MDNSCSYGSSSLLGSVYNLKTLTKDAKTRGEAILEQLNPLGFINWEYQIFKEFVLTLVMLEYAVVTLSCVVAAVTFGFAATIRAFINRLSLDLGRLISRKRPVTKAICMSLLLNVQEV